MSHSNIVINLIGRGIETKNFSFEDTNITGPQTIARICKEAGVKRFVHMSHINAREQPESAFLPGGSKFLKTKFLGELAVRNLMNHSDLKFSYNRSNLNSQRPLFSAHLTFMGRVIPS